MSVKKQTKDNRQELAEILFMQGYMQKEIAKMVGAAELTVSRWAKADNWEERRKRTLNGKNHRLAELYDELAEFNKMIAERDGYKIATSKEADVRRKLIRDIADLESKYNIAQTTTIARDFVMFLRREDAELAEIVLKHFDAFINDIVQHAKWQD